MPQEYTHTMNTVHVRLRIGWGMTVVAMRRGHLMVIRGEALALWVGALGQTVSYSKYRGRVRKSYERSIRTGITLPG